MSPHRANVYFVVVAAAAGVYKAEGRVLPSSTSLFKKNLCLFLSVFNKISLKNTNLYFGLDTT